MRDGNTGKILWESGPWNREMFESESEGNFDFFKSPRHHDVYHM